MTNNPENDPWTAWRELVLEQLREYANRLTNIENLANKISYMYDSFMLRMILINIIVTLILNVCTGAILYTLLK